MSYVGSRRAGALLLPLLRLVGGLAVLLHDDDDIRQQELHRKKHLYYVTTSRLLDWRKAYEPPTGAHTRTSHIHTRRPEKEKKRKKRKERGRHHFAEVGSLPVLILLLSGWITWRCSLMITWTGTVQPVSFWLLPDEI